jgi:hypothetical protein
MTHLGSGFESTMLGKTDNLGEGQTIDSLSPWKNVRNLGHFRLTAEL